MTTLVIHPKDNTTDFMSILYEGKDWTIFRQITNRTDLLELIDAHDRIIMVGHGTPSGLIIPRTNSYLIDSRMVYILKTKLCVGIWCYANMFFEKYDLKGMYTGMIISEFEEAVNEKVFYQTSNEHMMKESFNHIHNSNDLFSVVMRDYISGTITLNDVKTIYKSEDNPIIKYNQERIFER